VLEQRAPASGVETFSQGSAVPSGTAQLRLKTTRPFLTVFISYLGEWA
jgi:hypothetical protein